MVEFLTAEEVYRREPGRFTVLTDEDLDVLEPEMNVKVRVGEEGKSEGFFVELEEVGEEELTGVINNDLLHTCHGLKCGDRVTFKRENVYEIYDGW